MVSPSDVHQNAVVGGHLPDHGSMAPQLPASHWRGRRWRRSSTEQTAGLDPRNRNDLWSVIEQLVADGSTLLLTTPYSEEADRHADQVAGCARGFP